MKFEVDIVVKLTIHTTKDIINTISANVQDTDEEVIAYHYKHKVAHALSGFNRSVTAKAVKVEE